MTVTEWADQYRVLPDDSAEPGRYRSERTPYARKIQDVLSPSSPAEMVVVCAAAQVVKTESGINWLFYNIDQQPGTMLFVQPTVEAIEKTSTQRLEKSAAAMAESRPNIARAFSGKSRDKRNTIRLLGRDLPVLSSGT